ncbi:PKD domain-containing protein [Flavobacterium sp. Arc3]|uniref:PKD-like domain-containing protein n=1 Tax=Flavobacterium sp. Arc3 TaxID=3046686 RepID=UPI00352CE6C7
MRNIHKIIFLFVLINFNSIPSYSINKAEESIIIKTVADPSGQITGNATVCQNAAAPLITFEVKDDNKEPYTFTYTINGVLQTPIATQGNNKSVTVPAPTNVTGTFTYVLTGVKDKTGNDVGISSSNPVTITVIPNFTVSAGSDILLCNGNTINLNASVSGNGSNAVTYSWSGPNSFTSNQQSPSISNSSIVMSGDYTVTASIGSCSVQDVVHVDVAEPQITSGQLQNGILVKCTTSPSQTTGVINFLLTIPSYSSNIQNYTIDWGFGSPSTQVLTSVDWSNTILHTYNVGMHLISITINFTNGCSITKQFNAFVGSSPAAATLVLNQNQANGCAPLTTQWTFTVPNNVDGTTYSGTWGEMSTQDNFVYNQGGSVPPATSTMSWSSPSIDPGTLTSTYIITKTYLSSSCGINVVLGATTYYNTYQPIVITQNPCTTTPQPSGTGLVSVGKAPLASFAPTPFPTKICIGIPFQLTNTSSFGQTIPTSNGATCLTTGNFYWTITALTPVTTGAWIASGLGSNNGLTEADFDSWTNGSMTPTITFNQLGNYRITLFIANSCGVDSVSKDICVQSQVTPLFSLINPLIGCKPLVLIADSSATNTSVSCSPVTYQWNVVYTSNYCGVASSVTYLNGTSATSQNPTFQFNNAGTYNVSLTTTNSCGSVTSTPQTVTVKQPPTVTINPIASLCQTLPTTTISPSATIVNCGTQSPLTYEWSFPGGTASTPATLATANPGTISYSTSGTFSYSLKVTNECGTTTSSSSFTINPSPTISGTLFSCIGTSSQLTGSPSAAAATPWTSSAQTVATVNNTGLVTGVSAGTTTITYTNNAGCKTTALFTVNPSPVVTFSPANQIICSGDTSALVTLNSTTPGATFNWTAVQPTGISGVSTSGTDIIPAQTLINSTNANIVLTYNAKATSANGASCAGALFPYTITVKPKPNVAANMTAAICSGSAFTVTPTNGAGNIIPAGTIYSWGVPTVTAGITGGVGGTSPTTISGTLTNLTNVVQTATYSVIPSFNGCSGTAFDVVVSVNPKPVIPGQSSTICSGDAFTVIPSNGIPTAATIVPLNTTYTWLSPTSSPLGAITGGSAQATPQTSISQTVNNSSNAPATLTYTVTPKSGDTGNCPGATFTVTVTVNPKPLVTPQSKTICSGTAFTISPTNGSGNIVAAGTTYTWADPVSNPVGAITGGSLQATDQPNISQTLTNTTNSSATLTYTVSPKSGTSGNCVGAPFTVTITVNPTPAALMLSNQEFCNGVATAPITFSNPVSGTTYSWSNSHPAIGLAALRTGNIPSFTPTNTSSSPIIATINVTPTANGCSGIPQTFNITVNPSPVVTFSPSNQTICSGDSSALVTLNSASPGVTFNWTAAQPAGISAISTSGTNTIPTQTLVNSTNTSIVITYNAKATLASGGSCTGALFPYTITVKPKPYIATNMTATICSGISFSVTPANGAGNIIPAGTTYSWAAPAVTGGVTGGVAGTNSATISGPLTNPTNVVQTATYTVIPSANGCAGLPFDIVVSVNPKPDVNATTSVALCAGISSTLIDFTGNVPGTTYNWSSSTTSIGIAASGTNTIPSFTAINTGATAVTATITVTPFVNGCTGLSKTFDITVNPNPTVNSTPNLVKCNTASSGVINFSGNASGTTFDWTNDTASIGLATAGSGNIASFTATNTGLISVTATITVTPKANGCFGTPKTFTITVNPTPTVDLPLSQTVCNGQSSAAILFSGAIQNTVYNWTNSNPAIGIGATGVGDIPSFTAINNGTNPIVANFTVTPSLNGCNGVSRAFTITINPSPAVVFSPTNQILCSASSSVSVILSSTMTGTNFTWTALEPAGISGVITSGTSTIPVQTLTNSTNLPIVVTYLAKAESNSGASCQGVSYPYTITVNPVPSITTAQNKTICSNTSFSIIPSNGSGNIVPAGTTYSWGVPVITGGITGAVASTNQTTINGTLVNPTNDVQTATYTIIPKSGSCIGSSFTAVITVNPSPKVVFSGGNQTVCSGSDSSPISIASPTTGTVTFNWTANIPAGISGATPSGTNTIPAQTLVNLTTNPLTVTYTAAATFDNNGVSCSGPTLDYKIIVNPAIITSSILSNFNGFNVSSVGVSDGAINVTVTGGSGDYTYLWSGPGVFSATSQDISNVAAGAYTLTINDSLCNAVILNFTLTSPLPLLIQEDTAAHIDVLCFGYLTGTIKVAITQQSVGPYDYVLTLQGGGTIISIIDSAATNYTFTGLAAGIYDIKVTDGNGSVKTIPGIVITQPSGITASISGLTDVSCAGNATGSATVTASGGIGNLTYSWNTSPIQTLATATALTAGTYTVTITDANNCSIQKQAVITEPNGILTSIASQTNVLCFGNSTGSATVLASGGTGVLTYSWNTVPVQSIATATGLTAGNYNVTVTDANGCSKVQTVLITQPLGALSSIISNSNNVSCFGGNDGSATVSVSGGTSPYSYSWNTSPIQTLSTATGLKAGIYNVTVTDANGCGISSPITITEPAGMSAIITAQTDVFCSGNSTGSATVTANGGTSPFTYSWNTTPIQTSNVAINLAIGTYTVTVTDSKACSTSTQAIITEPNGIVTAIASQTNVDCFGNNTGAVSVLASGGTGTLTYSWDTVPVQTSLNATGLIAGTYHLTVTDANNCAKVQTVNITQPDDIVITTDLEKDISCFNDANGEIKITISGGTLNYKFTWTKNGTPYATTKDLSNLSPGVYVVSVSDANNCGPKTRPFTITEPPILAVSLISQTNILCFGESTGAINISAVGGTPAISGYNFAWTGPNGFTSSNKNLSAIIAGTYDLVVTDNSGCSKTLSVTLSQPTNIVLTATTTPIICYGSNDASITLTINGGVAPYAIVWSNMGGGTFQDNLSAGDYLITVTDSNNCTKTLNVNIPEAPIFTINPVVKDISCFGDHNGSINLNLVGGIAPVKLTWDDNATAGNVRNNLGPGSYTVTIVDSKPCTIKRTFIILEPQLLALSANVTNAFDCDNANSGAINLLVAGGTAPFTYTWSNGTTTEDLFNISAGNYLVTVKDANGCSKQAQFSINRPPAIVIGVVTKTEFDCETKYVKQSFVAQVSGGVPPYQLVWSSGTVSGANNETMNTSQNGTAILYVTDAIGCKSNYSFNVKLQYLGTPSYNASSYAYSSYGSYSINDPIQFTNTATGDYISVAWDFGDGSVSTEPNPVHTFINPKDYVVTQTVTYPFGCVYVQKITFIVEKGYLLVVPNAFTPNDDNLNDTFRPVTKALKNVRLDIYDTWGSLIYSETGEILRGWDGKIKGQNAENGNYYCKVSGETFYGTVVNVNHPFVLIK